HPAGRRDRCLRRRGDDRGRVRAHRQSGRRGHAGCGQLRQFHGEQRHHRQQRIDRRSRRDRDRSGHRGKCPFPRPGPVRHDPGPAAAADLVQETFLAALRSFPNFRGESQLSTWLISILRNQYSLFLRGRRKSPAPLEEEGRRLAAPEPPERVEEGVRLVFERVKELPEDLRTTLALFYVEGFKYAEIARVMECPIGTVRSRLFEARERLKKLCET